MASWKKLVLMAIFGAALLLAGCVTPTQPVQMQTKFDPEIHKQYLGNGNNIIKGEAFLRQRGGGVVTCAGSDVGLLPATPYFREALNIMRTGNRPVTDKIDPAYKSMIKYTQGDAQGNFTFNNLPDGNWFVFTEVKWAVGDSRQGGTLLKEVNLTNGETKQVLLTDQDLIGW